MPNNVHRISSAELNEYDRINLFDHLFNFTFETVKALYETMLEEKGRRSHNRTYRSSGLRNIRMLTLNLKDISAILRKQSIACDKENKAARNEYQTKINNEIQNRRLEKKAIQIGELL